ncbi:MAG: PqqD family peptide modification chaperone [Pseudomonadota bacterium]
MIKHADLSEIRLTRGTDHVETRHGDRVMAMSIAQGKYFAIEGTGARIWELLSTPKSEAELVEILCEDYNVTPEQCLGDLRAFIQDLKDHDLVVEVRS